MASLNEELKSEWHPIKNLPTNLDEVKVTSKVWWRCKLGHEWEAVVDDRMRGRGCGYCANKKVLTGFNDLSTTHPELAQQWHPTKNDKVTPLAVIAGSHKRAWWLCEKGHEWESPIVKRKLGHGCVYCTNQKVLEGFNDLATTHPALAKEWHPTKNKSLKPQNVIGTGKTKVWWLCDKGHEWASTVNKRKSAKHGCIYCTNQKVLLGFNDFGTTHPELAKEWHPTKNGNLTPSQVIKGSGQKIWWIGECGHEWAAILRDKGRYGCPRCPTNVSAGEKSLYSKLLETYPKLTIIQSDRSVLNNLELDIYIPEYNLAIEYNGLYWHSSNIRKNPNYHYNKWLACKKNNIALLQVWSDEWLEESDRIINIIGSYIEPTINKFLTTKYMYNDEIDSSTTRDEEERKFRSIGIFDQTNTLIAKAKFNKESSNIQIVTYKTYAYKNAIKELVNFIHREHKDYQITVLLDNMLMPDYDLSDLRIDSTIKPKLFYYYNQRKFTKEELFHQGLAVAKIESLPKLWDAGATLYRLQQ